MTEFEKVKPYHSIVAQRYRGIYHDRADCPTGHLIHSEDLVAGTAGLPRCDQCRALDEPTPEPPAA